MTGTRTAIELTDQMTAPLMNIVNSLNLTISAFQNMQGASAGSLSNDLETLRHQLNQAVALQNELSSDMERMDVSAVNASYEKLNSVIDSTDVHIRENISAQNEFNNSVRQGSSMLNGQQKGKIGAAHAVFASLREIGKVLDLSDSMTQTTARLNLMNDGMQTTQELQDMIFSSAQRSRSEYGATSDMVANLGQSVGEVFSSNQETIQFAENLNKQFVIAEANQQEMSSASLQLTHALRSGVLRGEELNAVFEASPNIIQTIADYLGVPIEKIHEMASDGEITADIVKNAILSATDEINEQFEQIRVTFERISTSIQNDAMMALQPLLSLLNELANSAAFDQLLSAVTSVASSLADAIEGFLNTIDFDSLVQGITGALVVVSGIIIEIFNMAARAAGFISENWSIISPLIYGVVAALGVYALSVGIVKGIELACAIASGVMSVAKGIQAAAIWIATSATWAAVTAQLGLNAAMRACPIVWIIIAIIAIIAIFYAVVAAVNKFAETSISATGNICGAFMLAVAVIGNVLVTLINFVIDIFAVLWNFIAAFANFFENVLNDPVGAIARLFFDLADTVLSLLKSLASAIDTIFGSNLAGSVQGWRDSLNGWVDDTFAQETEIMAKVNSEDMHLERFVYEDAWDAGYKFGEGIDKKISEFDPRASLSDQSPSVNEVPNNVQNISENTGKIKDSIDVSKEDLKFIRDIAGRDSINRFTTAKIDVKMTNNNNVRSNMDLDGISEHLRTRLEREMQVAAEGVH